MANHTLYPTKTNITVGTFHGKVSIAIKTAGSSSQKFYFDSIGEAQTFAEDFADKIAQASKNK